MKLDAEKIKEGKEVDPIGDPGDRIEVPHGVW